MKKTTERKQKDTNKKVKTATSKIKKKQTHRSAKIKTGLLK